MGAQEAELEYELELIEDIAQFTHDPLGYAHYAFPWGQPKTALEKHNAPREWQEDTLRDIGDHLSNPETRFTPLQIAIASGHGIGKGRPKYCVTLVPVSIISPSGDVEVVGMKSIQWGELKIGDYVFGADGKPTKILATNHYRREHYRVTFDDGSSTVVSGEHEWNVRGRKERRKGAESWLTLETEEIIRLGVKRKNGNAMARQWEIPIQGAVEFAESSGLPLSPYIMGLWISDGNGHRITKKSRAVRDKVISLHHGKVSESADGSSIGILKADWSDDIFRCRSWEKFIPDAYKYSSVSQRKALFEGLMDGDGEVNSSGSCGYSSSSEQLVDDVVWLARSLGYKASRQPTIKRPTYTHKGEKITGRPCYRATINTTENPFTHEKRKAAWKPSDSRYLKRWIESIEPTGMADGMCIEVEADDHLYLDDHFIVTHNSALIGMILKWGLDTCEDTRIICTSNTDTQLKSKTVPEVTKWQKASLTADWFIPTATAIYSSDSQYQKAWRADFIPWSVTNTEAFAGLHNEGKRIIIIFDEASAIDDKIWEVAEGAMTDENTEIIWIAFGNPTRSTGRFRECFRKYKKYWITRNIDSRDVEGTNKQFFERLVEQYGEDSDVVKVRVKGQFPNMSARQLFATDLVDAAWGRHLREQQYDFAPKIIAVDPAWEGDDDLLIGMRQGLYFQILKKLPKNSNDIEVANLITRLEDEHEADAVFIDGGYGTGIVSAGRTMGRNWQLVWFNGKSPREDCVNLRAAMYQNVAELLGEGLAIPKDQDLYDEMVATETIATLDGKIKLPPKDLVKKELGRSPNCIDCLAISTAYPVTKKHRTGLNAPHRKAAQSYNTVNDRLNRANRSPSARMK